MRLDGRTTFIQTFTLDDAAQLLELRIRNKEFFEPYEPTYGAGDFTLEAVREGIAMGIKEEQEDRGHAFAIRSVADDALVGRIRLSGVFRGPWQNGNLGYYIDQARSGRGHATEAVRLATTFAFDHAKLHRVQAAVLTDNPRSMRVLEKNGFRREGDALRYLKINGVWRDHVIFAITAEEFSPQTEGSHRRF